MRANQKGIISIFIIILVVIVMGIVVWGASQANSNREAHIPTPTPTINNIKKISSDEVSSETTDWKIYSNKALGFTIMYPEREVIIDKESDQGVTFTYPKYKDSANYPPTSLQILYRGAIESTPLDALTSETPIINGKRNLGEYEFVQINNAYGIHTITGFASDYNYYLTNNDKPGVVVRVDASSDINEDIEVFGKMIKTFKFLD